MSISAFLAATVLSLFGQEDVRVVLRVEGALAPSTRSFSLGVPLRPGALSPGESFFLQRPDGGRDAVRSTVLSRWPDGSVHWLRLEGIAKQEKVVLVSETTAMSFLPWVLQYRVEREEHRMESKSLAILSRPESEGLFDLAMGEISLRGDLVLGSGMQRRSASQNLRSQFAESTEGLVRALRVQGELEIPNAPGRSLGFDMRAEPLLAEPQIRLEVGVWNPSHESCEIENLELTLRLDGSSLRAFWTLGENDWRIQSPKQPLRIRSSGTGRSLQVCERFCWEGDRSLCIFAPSLAELAPKEVILDPQGLLRFRILAGSQTLPAFSSVSWAIALRAHRPEAAAGEHRRNRGEIAEGTAHLLVGESRGLEREAFDSDPGFDARWEPVIEEGIRRLSREMAEHTGWRDCGDHRLRGRWSHLEFDTAAGLFRRALRSGDESLARLASQSVEHWKTQDRFFAPVGDPRRFLPAVHGYEHASASYAEPGHLWAQGLLLHYAWSGSLSSRQAAIELGDAMLLRHFWGRDDGRGLERHWAWPLLALSALHEFFPQRGYERGMEEIVEELLLRRQVASGVFLFDGRVEKDEGAARVNLWQSGGVLLEALARYRDAGGRQDILPTMQSLARWIVREGWDRKKQRFVHTVEVALNSSETLGRWGNLRPVWEIYLISQLLSLPDPDKGLPSSRALRRRVFRLLEDFRWPKEEAGNDLSLLLRAEPGLRRAFSGS